MVEALCILDNLFNHVRLLDFGERVVFGELELAPGVYLFSIHLPLAMYEYEYWEGVIVVTGDLSSSIYNKVHLEWPVRLIGYVILCTRVNDFVGWLKLLDDCLILDEITVQHHILPILAHSGR